MAGSGRRAVATPTVPDHQYTSIQISSDLAVSDGQLRGHHVWFRFHDGGGLTRAQGSGDRPVASSHIFARPQYAPATFL